MLLFVVAALLLLFAAAVTVCCFCLLLLFAAAVYCCCVAVLLCYKSNSKIVTVKITVSQFLVPKKFSCEDGGIYISNLLFMRSKNI